jgi:hypothetical protein
MKGGEKRMKKTILATLLALALVLIPAGSAFAAPVTTATVTITMGGGEINISVDPINWNLGLVVQGGTYATSGDTFTLSNNSTAGLNIDVTITGANTADWTLDTTVSDNHYTLSYDRTGSWVNITTSAASYLANWTAPGTDSFDLQLGAPNPMTAGIGASQNTTITFDAVQTPTP